MRPLCCIVFSCLLLLVGAKHLGRQGYDQNQEYLQGGRYYAQQEQFGGQYGKNYYNNQNYNLLPIQQRQSFLLDILLQVQRPVVNPEILQLGDRLITEPSYYTQPKDKYLLQFFDQCKQGKIGSYELVGLYRFFVLARDYNTFQRNVAYARIYMDPYTFVTALQMAVRDREDCRDLIFPAFYEILPEYFYDKSIIDSANTIDFSVLSNGVSSLKPSLFNYLGVGRLLGGFRFNKPLMNQKYNQIDAKIILSGDDEQQITRLTDDVELNTFWNNIIAERQLQCFSGRRQQVLQGNKYQSNYQYYGKDKSQYYDDSYYNQYKNQYKNIKNSRDEIRQQEYTRYGKVDLDRQYNQGFGGHSKYEYENILGNKYQTKQELPEASIDSDRLLHVNRRRYEQKYGNQQQYGQQYDNEQQYYKYGQEQQQYDDKQQYYQGKYGQHLDDQQQYYQQKYGQKYGDQQKYDEKYYQNQYNNVDDLFNTIYRQYVFGKNIIGEGHKVEQYKSYGEDYNQNLYKGKQQKYDGQYSKYYGDQYYKQGEQGQYGRNYDYQQEKQGQRNYYQSGKYDKEGQRYLNQYKEQRKQYDQYHDNQNYYQGQQEERQSPYGYNYGQESQYYNKYPIVEGDRMIVGRYPRSIESHECYAQNLMAYRSGEIFIQNLRQIIARLNLEGLALTLEQEPAQNYELGLQMTGRGGQYYRKNIENQEIVYQSIDKAIRQLRTIINEELRRQQINENTGGVFRVLTDVLMDYNQQYNGNAWDYIYNNIVRDIYSNYNQEKSYAYDYYLYGAQYLNQPIRNLRDPIYIEIIYKLVQFINEYTRQIQPYGAQELMYNDVTLKDVNVDRLITYTQQYDYDLINLIDEPLNKDKLSHIQSKVVVRKDRLNHQPFTMSYELQSQKQQAVVVRTLLGPKYNEQQQLVSLHRDYDKFIVLDAYVQNLNVGENYIQRSSHQIARYAGRTVTTLGEIYQRVLLGKSFEDLSSDQGRFPHHLLLPRGTSQGLPMQLLVVVTPLDDQYYHENIDYRQIYGYGISTLNLDNLPLNYPLDRDMEISEHEFVQYPNVYLKDVEIVHKYNY